MRGWLAGRSVQSMPKVSTCFMKSALNASMPASSAKPMRMKNMPVCRSSNCWASVMSPPWRRQLGCHCRHDAGAVRAFDGQNPVHRVNSLLETIMCGARAPPQAADRAICPARRRMQRPLPDDDSPAKPADFGDAGIRTNALVRRQCRCVACHARADLLSALTNDCAHRLAVRTTPSHGANRGSIPLGRTNLFNDLAGFVDLIVKYPATYSGEHGQTREATSPPDPRTV